ncbi:MAG: hypothetical protein EA397_14910 [Deltaproteobacteria bacterium]|nr:MAG: hypothetical protein EA397_14910 [Deltaproteobacteria bacterium]
MIALRIVLGASVGLVLGAAGSAWVLASGSAPSVSSDEPVARDSPCPEQIAAVRESQQLEQRLQIAEDLIRGLRATEVELIGEPPPWPDTLPEAFAEHQARETLERAFAGTPYEIDWIDCEEFPCIFATRWSTDPDSDDEEARPTRTLSVEELEVKGFESWQLQVHYGRHTHREFVAFAPHERVRELSLKRLQHRQRISEDVWQEQQRTEE